MKTLVNKMTTPNVQVRMSNIEIDVKKFTFKLTLGTKTSRQKNFREEVVTGKTTVELIEWLTLKVKERIKIVADNEQGFEWVESGNLLTGFQMFLKKRNLEFVPGILKSSTFTSDNKSEEFGDNPFKLIQYMSGHRTLTLVNIGSKSVVTKEDPTTGEVTEFWKRNYIKIGERMMPSFFGKKSFVRYLVQQAVEVVTYTKPANA